jgi:biopolymer transport protein TolQ
MNQELSILQLVINASFAVQVVMGILLIFSVISWGIIFSKWAFLTKIKFETATFLKQFNKSNNVAELYHSINKKSTKNSVTVLFFNGINEYNKLNQQGIKKQDVVMLNIERALSSSTESEIDNYEVGLSTLATFGSVSPYIGLLGTVWGIMHAFIGLGNTNQATLASVAPGIAEALVATAIGLFVAIPAYIFYNKFLADINRLSNKMNKFGDDFLNLISRRIASHSGGQINGTNTDNTNAKNDNNTNQD